MIDVNIINLVSTNLVQAKNELEYKINTLTQVEDKTPNKLDVIKSTLSEYNKTMMDIQLWESIISDINQNIDNSPSGENNNN